VKGKNGNVTFESLSIQELKKARTERITATRQLITRPCFLLDWEITAKSNDRALVTLYDGTSIVGRLIIYISVPAKNTVCQNYTFPRYFSQGLHIVIAGDTESATFHYLPQPVM